MVTYSAPEKPTRSQFATKTEYQRAWRQWRSKHDPEYKPMMARKMAEYRAKNPEKIVKHRKDAYGRNPEKYKKCSKNAWHADVGHSRKAQRERAARQPWSTMDSSSRARAKKESLPHDLTPDYIKSIWPADNCCPIFRTEFKKARLGESRDASASLERIDPTKGYVQGNVVIISLKANRMKNNGSLEELKRLVEYYANLLKTRLE